jgi:predicted  nucleic acid-binding Zn-ribbon protein
MYDKIATHQEQFDQFQARNAEKFNQFQNKWEQSVNRKVAKLNKINEKIEKVQNVNLDQLLQNKITKAQQKVSQIESQALGRAANKLDQVKQLLSELKSDSLQNIQDEIANYTAAYQAELQSLQDQQAEIDAEKEELEAER